MKTIPYPMYTVRDAERAIGLPLNMGYYYIRMGELEAVKDATGYRIPYDALIRFATAREAKKAS